MPGVKDWLRKASNDLQASKKLFDDNQTLDCCVFHTHQCAEKAFKTFIVLIQQAIPKTHNLTVLWELCARVDSAFMLLKGECKTLNPYGQDSRYPNDNFYINKKLAEEAVGKAEKILDAVAKIVDSQK